MERTNPARETFASKPRQEHMMTELWLKLNLISGWTLTILWLLVSVLFTIAVTALALRIWCGLFDSVFPALDARKSKGVDA
jgi:hypothetical protein